MSLKIFSHYHFCRAQDFAAAFVADSLFADDRARRTGVLPHRLVVTGIERLASGGERRHAMLAEHLLELLNDAADALRPRLAANAVGDEGNAVAEVVEHRQHVEENLLAEESGELL